MSIIEKALDKLDKLDAQLERAEARAARRREHVQRPPPDGEERAQSEVLEPSAVIDALDEALDGVAPPASEPPPPSIHAVDARASLARPAHPPAAPVPSPEQPDSVDRVTRQASGGVNPARAGDPASDELAAQHPLLPTPPLVLAGVHVDAGALEQAPSAPMPASAPANEPVSAPAGPSTILPQSLAESSAQSPAAVESAMPLAAVAGDAPALDPGRTAAEVTAARAAERVILESDGTGASSSAEADPGASLGVPQAAPRQVSNSGDVVGERTVKHIELDYGALAAAGIITPDTAQSGVAEQIRIIKRPLLLKASLQGESAVANGNVIQVTSALPSEGKTFTSVNLAMSMAMELDRTVLLVDADTARSDVGRILGIDAQEGLSDYLVNRERPLSQFLVKTDMPKLTILPAGRHYANMTELFSSDDMKAVVQELGTRYPDRIVLFDTAPLLATSGASVVAHLAGQLVLVVEAVRTPQSAVREALSMVEGISHDNVGIVLNKSRERLAGQYGYGYGYGYYFGSKR